MNDNTNTGGGFAAVPRWLQGRLTPQQLALFVALQWYADSDGFCWPSHPTLARDLQSSRRTVQRTLNQLREMGLVSWEERHDAKGQLTNRYRVVGLTAPEGWTPPPPQGHTEKMLETLIFLAQIILLRLASDSPAQKIV